MKSVYTLFFLLSIFFSLSTKKASAQEQIITEKHESAFYSDFYVMEVKPMEFKITYNFPVNERVRVRILDANRNILFGENAMVYKKYQKHFDLSAFLDGQYTFELADGMKTFTHSINVLTKTTRVVTSQNDEITVVTGF
ncbi:hypothetical protein [Dyadobacter sp. NIV53]|uniref:hypothetical protein n=1 Tax=Dyadobacter sp. NIV53 TaxID=2861765 RepID=UPI001C87B4D3|nr:hypothetical protein [Dyadobacter sp. NIV53]